MMVVQAAGASYKGRSSNPQVQATTAEYQLVRAADTRFGRFLVAADDRSRSRVAVIGDKLREDLKMPENPVGEFFQLGGDWFKVIGLMEKQGEIFGMSQDNYAMIPFSVGRAMMGQGNKPMIAASFTITSLDQAEAVRERARRAIRASRKLKPGQDDDFRIEASDSFIKQFEQVTSTITAVVGGIVGISLLVGGIGIMNIMLVSVTERTREIGIVKALGATRNDILAQFLLEAALLALLGGGIGIALGYAIRAGPAGGAAAARAVVDGRHRRGGRLAARRRQFRDRGFRGGHQLRPARFGHLLPVAVLERALDRVQQVEPRLEAGAAHAHVGLDRAGRGEVLVRAQADLAQPRRRLRPDVAQLARAHCSDSTQAAAIASSPRASSASKRPVRGLSRSSTPSRLPSAATSGTTHSDREAESQAMWPGNAFTSSTTWVLRL